MGYRWQNVKIECKEDGTTEITYEGRGELPFSESMELEPGESAVVHSNIEQGDLSEQPDDVEWYMKKDGEIVNRLEDED